jgi:hypothetical protein
MDLLLVFRSHGKLVLIKWMIKARGLCVKKDTMKRYGVLSPSQDMGTRGALADQEEARTHLQFS